MRAWKESFLPVRNQLHQIHSLWQLSDRGTSTYTYPLIKSNVRTDIVLTERATSQINNLEWDLQGNSSRNVLSSTIVHMFDDFDTHVCTDLDFQGSPIFLEKGLPSRSHRFLNV